MKNILIALFGVLLISSCAQQSFDCDAFLSQKIIASENADTDSLFQEFQKFKKCGLSEEDAQFLLTRPVIGVAMVELTKKKGSGVTFGDMLGELQEKKKLLDKAKSLKE